MLMFNSTRNTKSNFEKITLQRMWSFWHCIGKQIIFVILGISLNAFLYNDKTEIYIWKSLTTSLCLYYCIILWILKRAPTKNWTILEMAKAFVLAFHSDVSFTCSSIIQIQLNNQQKQKSMSESIILIS